VQLARAHRVSVAALAVFLAAVPAASAKNPDQVFAGQIITAKKRLPTSAKSANEYISKIRAAKTGKFWEDKAKGEWKIYYAAFFRKALNDLEITIKLYDVTGGKRALLTSFEQYLDGRGEKSVVSDLTLERKFVGVNKEVLMVVENRGTIYATGRFSLLGEAEHYSGKVDFSEEDTKGSDEE
jgi:hypothetical protein